MSFAALLGQEVTIVRAAASVDRYNDVSADWSSATRTVVHGRLQQTDTVEVAVGRDTVIADWVLFLPAGTDVLPSDRVEVDGATFEVVGLPNVAHTPRGPHHVEARLRSITG